MAYAVPPLPYAYDALEPVIDAETMALHHDRHHRAYVDALNKTLEGHSDLQGDDRGPAARPRRRAGSDPPGRAKQRGRARQPPDVLEDHPARWRQAAVRRDGAGHQRGVWLLRRLQGAL
jgi:hypothetical protein